MTTVAVTAAGQPEATDVSAPEPVAPRRPPRFPAFDGLRAIAALTVVGVHTAFVSGFTFRHPVAGLYTARLEIGVAVFFLISGFLLYRPFVVAHLAAGPNPRTLAFWMRRALRIVPAYWVALFLTATVLHAEPIGPDGWQAYVSHYLFGQIYLVNQDLRGITQAWSLDVEMSFYLFLPIFAAIVGWRRLHRTPSQRLLREVAGLVVLVAISLGWRFWVLANQHGHTPVFHLMTIWLPAEFDLFALGMLLAVLSAWSHQHQREPRFVGRWWFPWVCWLAAAGMFVAVSHIGIPTGVLYLKSDSDITRQTLYGLFSFFLLLPAVFGPERKGLIRKFLCCWPVASLGVISYAIYLWHQALIAELIKYYPRWFGSKLFFNVPWPQMLGEIAGAAIVVATASYFIVEKPALRLKGMLGWFRQPSDARRGGEAAAPVPTAPAP